jgi:hypothetical protein
LRKSSRLDIQTNRKRHRYGVEGADPLYEELRVENSLTDENGDKVRLKKDADVAVTLEADKEATIPKHSSRVE